MTLTPARALLTVLAATLLLLANRGLELSRTEVAALLNTDRTLWAKTADAIDPRLQKASLKNDTRVS